MNVPTDTVQKTESVKKDAAEERIAELEAKLAQAMDAIGALQSASAPVIDTQPVAEQPRNAMTLKDLRKYDGTLYIKHNDPQRQFSCHQALGEHRVDFDLGPAGRGDDIGIMPKLALEIRGIQRAWKRGMITISTDEGMEHEIDLMMNSHMSYAEETMAALQVQVMPSNNERDIVTKPCLRCGRYTRDQTGAVTPVVDGGKSMMTYGEYKAGRPPLCEMHQHEEHTWVGTLVTNPESGIQDWQFGSMIVGETQPGVPQQQPYTGPITPQHMQRSY